MYIVLKPHISVFQFFLIVDFWHQKVFGNYHYKNTVDVFTYKSQWYSLSHVIVFYHFSLIFLIYLHITVNEKPLKSIYGKYSKIFFFHTFPLNTRKNKKIIKERNKGFYNGKKMTSFVQSEFFGTAHTIFQNYHTGSLQCKIVVEFLFLVVYWTLRW